MSMTDRVIQTHVLLLVTDLTGHDPVTPSTTVESLGMDSLDFLELLVKIDERCGVELKPEDVIDCRTVGDLIRITQAAA